MSNKTKAVKLAEHEQQRTSFSPRSLFQEDLELGHYSKLKASLEDRTGGREQANKHGGLQPQYLGSGSREVRGSRPAWAS